jgi:cytochrome c oxidase subunit III
MEVRPIKVDLAERWHTRELGLWMFLGTVVMLFAAFTSAIVVRQSSGDWRPLELPPILWLNTAVLIGSSLWIEPARRARRFSPAAISNLIGAAGLGLLFLGGQVWAWRQLSAAGVYLSTNPSSSFFYILTGLHGLHLMAALLVLGAVLLKVRQPANVEMWPHLVSCASTFWHFLTGLWVYLMIVLSMG